MLRFNVVPCGPLAVGIRHWAFQVPFVLCFLGDNLDLLDTSLRRPEIFSKVLVENPEGTGLCRYGVYQGFWFW